MSASLDLTNEFAVFDGAESVTLRGPRTASGAEPNSITTPALRRALTVRELKASNGRYTASDVRWHLPTTTVTEAPPLGSTIVDGDGRAWTIIDVSRVTLGARWCCTTRAWEIAAGLSDRVAILRATWTKSASGVPIAEWLEVSRGAIARIQPIEARPVAGSDPVVFRATHRCFLVEPITVTEEMRARRGDELFAVCGVDDTERLDRGMTLLLEALILEAAR